MSYQTADKTPSARYGASANPAKEAKADDIVGEKSMSFPQDNTNQSTGQNDKQPILSSEGAIGSQFNPDGNIGQIGSKIGGPFDQDGMIGSQFDASKEGIAGKVERMVGGPRKET